MGALPRLPSSWSNDKKVLIDLLSKLFVKPNDKYQPNSYQNSSFDN